MTVFCATLFHLQQLTENFPSEIDKTGFYGAVIKGNEELAGKADNQINLIGKMPPPVTKLTLIVFIILLDLCLKLFDSFF